MNYLNKCVFFSACLFCFAKLCGVAYAEVNCVGTVSDIPFGNVALASGSAIASTGALSVTCKSDVAGITVRLCFDIDGGSAYDGTSRIANASYNSTYLRFQLYSDAAHTIPWGAWSDGLYSGGYTWDFPMTSNYVSAKKSVYGLILGGQQTVSTGDYSSKLTMNLSFSIVGDSNTACPDSSEGTGTDTFGVSATVEASCSVATTNMDFGAVDSLNSNIDATATVSPNCSSGTPYSVSLSNGNSGSSPTARLMVNGDSSISYGLYQDSARSLPWGSSIDSNTVGGTGTGSSQPMTVYGRVPSQTTPSPAIYTDTVVVIVTY